MELEEAAVSLRRTIFREDPSQLRKLERALRGEAVDGRVATPVFVRTVLQLHPTVAPRALELLVGACGDEDPEPTVSMDAVMAELRPPLSDVRAAAVADAWMRLTNGGQRTTVTPLALKREMRGSERARIGAYVAGSKTVSEADFTEYYCAVSALTVGDALFTELVESGQKQTDHEKALEALEQMDHRAASGAAHAAEDAERMAKAKCAEFLMQMVKGHGMTLRGLVAVEGYRRYGGELPPHVKWLKLQPVDESGANPVLVRQARGYATLFVTKVWLKKTKWRTWPEPHHRGRGFGLCFSLERTLDPARDQPVRRVVKGHAMKEDEAVRHAMRAWVAMIEINYGATLRQQDYCLFYEKLFAAMTGLSDKRRARAAAELDFSIDSEGRSTINLLQIGHVMFALADMWVDSCQPQHYFYFLSELYRKVWQQTMPAVGSAVSQQRDPVPGPGTHEVSQWYQYQGSKHSMAHSFPREGSSSATGGTGGTGTGDDTPGPGSYDSLASSYFSSASGFGSVGFRAGGAKVAGPGRWVRDAGFLQAAAAASNTPFIPYVLVEAKGKPCDRQQRWEGRQVAEGEEATWVRYCIERRARQTLQAEHRRVRAEHDRVRQAAEAELAERRAAADARYAVLEAALSPGGAADSDAATLAARLELQQSYEVLTRTLHSFTPGMAAQQQQVPGPAPPRPRFRRSAAAAVVVQEGAALQAEPLPVTADRRYAPAAQVEVTADRRYRVSHALPERPAVPETPETESDWGSDGEEGTDWPTAQRRPRSSMPRSRSRSRSRSANPRPASAFPLPYSPDAPVHPAPARRRKRLRPVSSKLQRAPAVQARATREHVVAHFPDAFEAAEQLQRSAAAGTAVSRLAARDLAGLVDTREVIPSPAVPPPGLLVDRMVLEQLLLSRSTVGGGDSAGGGWRARARP